MVALLTVMTYEARITNWWIKFWISFMNYLPAKAVGFVSHRMHSHDSSISISRHGRQRCSVIIRPRRCLFTAAHVHGDTTTLFSVMSLRSRKYSFVPTRKILVLLYLRHLISPLSHSEKNLDWQKTICVRKKGFIFAFRFLAAV